MKNFSVFAVSKPGLSPKHVCMISVKADNVDDAGKIAISKICSERPVLKFRKSSVFWDLKIRETGENNG